MAGMFFLLEPIGRIFERNRQRSFRSIEINPSYAYDIYELVITNYIIAGIIKKVKLI